MKLEVKQKLDILLIFKEFDWYLRGSAVWEKAEFPDVTTGKTYCRPDHSAHRNLS
jgi:hypothetical protein